MSKLYDKILQEIRPVPGYFRVAFYGRGFPAFLQNKVSGRSGTVCSPPSCRTR